MNPPKIDFSVRLEDRQILEIRGNDRESFLQGLITNDVQLLQHQPIIYSLMLSPQGKFQFDFFIINHGDTWLIDIDKTRSEIFLKRLQLFKLRSDVTIKMTDAWQVGGSLKKQNYPHCYIDPRLADLGYRIYHQALNFNDSQEIYEHHRLSLGVPDGAFEMIVDKSIPLEWGMDELGAIAWNKGCYMGQELTARSRYVGEIRKRAFPVQFSVSTTYNVGDKITASDKDVGELRATNGNIGIALLKLEALSSEMFINAHPINVLRPAWIVLKI